MIVALLAYTALAGDAELAAIRADIQAATDAGDVPALIEAYTALRGEGLDEEADLGLLTVATDFGTVELIGKAQPLALRPPVPSGLRANVLRFANAQLAQEGTYTGHVPVGTLRLGATLFTVESGADPFTVDVSARGDLVAGCGAAHSTSEVTHAVDALEDAFEELEPDKVTWASDTLRAQLPCVRETIDTALVARIHRMEALRHAIDDQEDAAAASFAAARSLEPDYALPTSLVPAGHPWRNAYDRVDLSAFGASPVAAGWLINGKESGRRPTGWPALVQQLDGDRIVATQLLPADAPWPGASAKPLRDPAPKPVKPPKPPKEPSDGGKLGLPIAAGGLAIAATGGALATSSYLKASNGGYASEEAHGSGKTLYTAGLVMVGVGGAAAIAGIALPIGDRIGIVPTSNGLAVRSTRRRP